MSSGENWNILEGPQGRLPLTEKGRFSLLKRGFYPHHQDTKGEWWYRRASSRERVVWEHKLQKKGRTIQAMKDMGWTVVSSGEYPKRRKWKKWYHIKWEEPSS